MSGQVLKNVGLALAGLVAGLAVATGCSVAASDLPSVTAGGNSVAVQVQVPSTDAPSARGGVADGASCTDVRGLDCVNEGSWEVRGRGLAADARVVRAELVDRGAFVYVQMSDRTGWITSEWGQDTDDNRFYATVHLQRFVLPPGFVPTGRVLPKT